MLKVYLAARFQEAPAMRSFAALLKASGIDTTSRWFDGTHELRSDLDEAKQRQRFAAEDLEDIDAADALVLFNPAEHHRSGTGGRHVEVGYAIGTQKPIFIVGARENVFHWHPSVTAVGDFAALIVALKDGWA